MDGYEELSFRFFGVTFYYLINRQINVDKAIFLPPYYH